MIGSLFFHQASFIGSLENNWNNKGKGEGQQVNRGGFDKLVALPPYLGEGDIKITRGAGEQLGGRVSCHASVRSWVLYLTLQNNNNNNKNKIMRT
jgi:hypothetical protein